MHLPLVPRVDADVDALIVGSGPAGLYAAYCGGFRGLSVAAMDSLPEIGGQAAAMYPEKMIYDVAGFPAVRGRDLVAGLAAQAARYRPMCALGEEASGLEYVDGPAVVTASSGLRVRAKFVIVTSGIGTFKPRRLAPLDGFERRGLAYFVPQSEGYRDKDVVIVGGGDSAFDWALTLEPLARSVTLVRRRVKFRAHEALVQQVAELPATLVTNAEEVAAHGDGSLEAVGLLQKQSRRAQRVQAQAVVAALGFIADIRPLEALGLETAERRIVVGTTLATSLPRVYAAGDITQYPRKVRFMSVAFGEAATAVNNAAAALYPGTSVFPGHVSDLRDHAGAGGEAPDRRRDAA